MIEGGDTGASNWGPAVTGQVSAPQMSCCAERLYIFAKTQETMRTRATRGCTGTATPPFAKVPVPTPFLKIRRPTPFYFSGDQMTPSK